MAAALWTPGCARSVNDHLAEARSNSPGAVQDAVIAIGKILHRKEAAGVAFDEADREAVLYLKDVAARDSVPINRAVALGALGRLRRAEASEVYLKALDDAFWPSRLEAARAMAHDPRESFAEPLRDLLARESRSEVRLQAVKTLCRIKGPVALRTLLDVFLRRPDGPRDPHIHAYVGIREMTGLSHGFHEIGTWDEYYRSTFGAGPSADGSPQGAPLEGGLQGNPGTAIPAKPEPGTPPKPGTGIPAKPEGGVPGNPESGRKAPTGEAGKGGQGAVGAPDRGAGQ